MRGYPNQPEQTAAAFDAEGFLRTGDLATIDDDGYVTIVGRWKEIMINAAGSAHLARVEQVKRFAIVPTRLSGDDELTPSKLKREPIAENYAAQMDALYS